MLRCGAAVQIKQTPPSHSISFRCAPTVKQFAAKACVPVHKPSRYLCRYAVRCAPAWQWAVISLHHLATNVAGAIRMSAGEPLQAQHTENRVYYTVRAHEMVQTAQLRLHLHMPHCGAAIQTKQTPPSHSISFRCAPTVKQSAAKSLCTYAFSFSLSLCSAAGARLLGSGL